MVNTILKYWDEPPELRFDLSPEFPIGGFTSGEVPWDELLEQYGEGVYINHDVPELRWEEEILTLKDLDQSLEQEHDGIVDLEGKVIDSYTIQAQRRGVEKDVSYLETAIYCFTTDGKRLLLGARGGSESIGKIIGVPAGAVSFSSSDNPIKDSVYREANEEAGILEEEIEPELIGAFKQEPGSAAPSDMFVYISEVSGRSLEDIQQEHSRAMGEYRRAKDVVYKSTGKNPGEDKKIDADAEIYARSRLRQLGSKDETFPADAWENAQLEIFPYDDSMVSSMVDFVKDNELKHSLYAAFALLVRDRLGAEAYNEIIGLPKFKENIVSRI